MIAQLSQWATGIELGWAIASLMVGVAILVYIATRLWRDRRDEKKDERT